MALSFLVTVFLALMVSGKMHTIKKTNRDGDDKSSTLQNPDETYFDDILDQASSTIATPNNIDFEKYLDEVALQTLQLRGQNLGGPEMWKLDEGIKATEASILSSVEETESCKPQEGKSLIDERQLFDMKESLLESLYCGRRNCSKIVVTSEGRAAILHPARIGLYSVSSMHDRFPVYYRPISRQHMFFQKEFNKWEYAHRIQRWIIGPKVDDPVGGIMIFSTEKCPWRIKNVEVLVYDPRNSETFSNMASGWKEDQTFQIECYDDKKYPKINCHCSKLNISSSGVTAKYHPDKLGTYDIQPAVEGLLAPPYRNENGNLLYSHHPSGKSWLIGKTWRTWAMRWNNIKEVNTRPEDKKFSEAKSFSDETTASPFCPHFFSEFLWEVLIADPQREQNWHPDPSLKVECIEL